MIASRPEPTSPARFLLTPLGSGGDVYPFVGIGRELRARGHEVVLLTAEPFRSSAEAAGLTFGSIVSARDFDYGAGHPDLWHPRKGFEVAIGLLAREAFLPLWEALEEWYAPGRTVLLGHTLSLATRAFEDAHGVPAATIHLAPSAFRSRYRQPVIVPGRDVSGYPGFLKESLWWLIDRLAIDPLILPWLNPFLSSKGLPPVRRVFRDWLHSPRRVLGLFPDWFGDPQRDWPAQTRLTGFPLYDGVVEPKLPAPIEDFLERGSPPVAFAPGTENREAADFFEAGVEALARLGERGILLTRHRQQVPSHLPDAIVHAPYLPFRALLPRCRALVHHGGIGTTSQALAAGIPQVVWALGFDQPDNGARLEGLGVGRVLPPARFDAPRLAETLRALIGSAPVEGRCRELALRLSKEEGVKNAADEAEALA